MTAVLNASSVPYTGRVPRVNIIFLAYHALCFSEILFLCSCTRFYVFVQFPTQLQCFSKNRINIIFYRQKRRLPRHPVYGIPLHPSPPVRLLCTAISVYNCRVFFFSKLQVRNYSKNRSHSVMSR